jgi:hypothetical protein
MLRGGGIGGLVGLGLTGALLIVSNTQNACYTAPSSVPGLDGGCSANLSFSKGSAILIGGAAAGAVVGSFLGYMYHVNENEQRAARCKASPAECT